VTIACDDETPGLPTARVSNVFMLCTAYTGPCSHVVTDKLGLWLVKALCVQ